MKQNFKFFYSYANKFSKTNSEIAAFEKKNGGELTNDSVEHTKMLLEQQKSVASEPRDDFKVGQDFFTESDEWADCFRECIEDGIDDPDSNLKPTDLYNSLNDIWDCIDMLSAGAAAGHDGVPAR